MGPPSGAAPPGLHDAPRAGRAAPGWGPRARPPTLGGSECGDPRRGAWHRCAAPRGSRGATTGLPVSLPSRSAQGPAGRGDAGKARRVSGCGGEGRRPAPHRPSRAASLHPRGLPSLEVISPRGGPRQGPLPAPTPDLCDGGACVLGGPRGGRLRGNIPSAQPSIRALSSTWAGRPSP